MFEFGTLFGIPLAYRNQDSHDIGLKFLRVLNSSEFSERQKIKSITAKEIKKALTEKNDLRDSAFNNLQDTDLSDSEF